MLHDFILMSFLRKNRECNFFIVFVIASFSLPHAISELLYQYERVTHWTWLKEACLFSLSEDSLGMWTSSDILAFKKIQTNQNNGRDKHGPKIQHRNGNLCRNKNDLGHFAEQVFWLDIFGFCIRLFTSYTTTNCLRVWRRLEFSWNK